MRMSDAGIAILRELEGSSTHVYNDVAGLPTIGVGHLLTKNELMSGKILLTNGDGVLDYLHGLSDNDIDTLLRQDLFWAEQVIATQVTVPLTQLQFDALVCFCFNIGAGAFRNSTLLRRLNVGAYAEVPTQLRRWVHAAGRVVQGLRNRREQEVALWEKDDVHA